MQAPYYLSTDITVIRQLGWKRLLAVAAVAVCLATSGAAHAALIGFEFTATTSSNPTAANFWGLPQAPRSPIVGRFIFDTDAVAETIAGCASCGRYAQDFPKGFSASFGGLKVSADEYFVEVRNNSGANQRDSITIRHASNLTHGAPPVPLSPLMVDGVPRAADSFVLTLSSANQGTVFNDAALPLNLYLASFTTSPPGLLLDAATGIPDVTFTVTSLRRMHSFEFLGTPEPAGISLLVSGGLIVAAQAERRRRRLLRVALVTTGRRSCSRVAPYAARQ